MQIGTHIFFKVDLLTIIVVQRPLKQTKSVDREVKGAASFVFGLTISKADLLPVIHLSIIDRPSSFLKDSSLCITFSYPSFRSQLTLL